MPLIEPERGRVSGNEEFREWTEPRLCCEDATLVRRTLAPDVRLSCGMLERGGSCTLWRLGKPSVLVL